MKNYVKFYSPFGDLYIIEEDGYLLNITCDDRKIWQCQNVLAYKDYPEVIKKTCRFLTDYFASNDKSYDIPYKIVGSDFKRCVLQECKKIPWGTTISYKTLAERVKIRLGKKQMSPQAIGNALHDNPILIYIPCHRVIKSDGTLGGFALGEKKKRSLLELEGNKEVIW